MQITSNHAGSLRTSPCCPCALFMLSPSCTTLRVLAASTSPSPAGHAAPTLCQDTHTLGTHLLPVPISYGADPPTVGDLPVCRLLSSALVPNPCPAAPPPILHPQAICATLRNTHATPPQCATSPFLGSTHNTTPCSNPMPSGCPLPTPSRCPDYLYPLYLRHPADTHTLTHTHAHTHTHTRTHTYTHTRTHTCTLPHHLPSSGRLLVRTSPCWVDDQVPVDQHLVAATWLREAKHGGQDAPQVRCRQAARARTRDV